jgi:hypothetical protein
MLPQFDPRAFFFSDLFLKQPDFNTDHAAMYNSLSSDQSLAFEHKKYPSRNAITIL